MSEHEIWNELGNLYFLAGSYDQAIHAYTRSVTLDKNFGRSYSNLATVYAQKGRYGEAIIFYQRSLPLLTDDREKAQAWYKLGNVYRTLKEYQLATHAYQQADELTCNLYPGLEMENEVDILLDRKPILGESLPFMDELHSVPPVMDATPPATPAEAAPTASAVPLAEEEFTPWWFDDQTLPEEEAPASEPELWEMGLTETPETEAPVLFKEPLQWKIVDLSESELQTENQVEETVAAVPEVEAHAVNVNVDETMSLLSVEEELAWLEPEQPTVLVEEPAARIIVVDPEQESTTPLPEFLAENLTNPEGIQYETLVESLTVELSPEERATIQADIDKFKRVLEVNPRNHAAWDSIGTQYKALGQYEEAISAYQKAVSLEGTRAFYFHHLGLVYAAVERIDDAIAAFEKVLEIDPSHSLAHATLGGYYRKMEMNERAQEHIEKARSLLDDDENEYNRACMEAICGNSDHALELLEVALKNKQTYVNWARRDPDLDFIRSDPRFHELLVEYATKPN